MPSHQLVAVAAGPTTDIVAGIDSGRLGAATPCAEFDVRGLINHLLYWGPSLAGAAHKRSVPPPSVPEADAGLVGSDWQRRLDGLVSELVAGWSEPAAWGGTSTMGGSMELPSAMIGGMVLGELVLHGWDLARATGQQVRTAGAPVWGEEVCQAVRDAVAEMAEQGRAMGVYGAEITVPASSDALDHALGLSGRDPHWAPRAH